MVDGTGAQILDGDNSVLASSAEWEADWHEVDMRKAFGRFSKYLKVSNPLTKNGMRLLIKRRLWKMEMTS